MQRRVSIVLLLLALFWVGEPAYALWNTAAEHACCLRKPAAEPSCHGMAHHAAGASFASQHKHSDCAHECCTKHRTANRSAIIARAVPHGFAETAVFIVPATAAARISADDSVVFERGPPTTA